MAALTSSVTQSDHTGWPDHKFLTEQAMVASLAYSFLSKSQSLP